MCIAKTEDGGWIEAGDWVVGGGGMGADFGLAFERDGQLWVSWQLGSPRTLVRELADLSNYGKGAERRQHAADAVAMIHHFAGPLTTESN